LSRVIGKANKPERNKESLFAQLLINHESLELSHPEPYINSFKEESRNVPKNEENIPISSFQLQKLFSKNAF
jgi:hypothetical protein